MKPQIRSGKHSVDRGSFASATADGRCVLQESGHHERLGFTFCHCLNMEAVFSSFRYSVAELVMLWKLDNALH
jgi:hypothetical protein